MRALSVRPPWAQHIIYGEKRIENRTWKTPYRGRIAIHASTRVDTHAIPFTGELVRSALIGTVELVDILTLQEALRKYPNQTQWVGGPYCWVLRNPKPLKKPIPYIGKLNLFNIPDEEILPFTV